MSYSGIQSSFLQTPSTKEKIANLMEMISRSKISKYRVEVLDNRNIGSSICYHCCQDYFYEKSNLSVSYNKKKYNSCFCCGRDISRHQNGDEVQSDEQNNEIIIVMMWEISVGDSSQHFAKEKLQDFKFVVSDIINDIALPESIVSEHFGVDIPSHGCKKDTILKGRISPSRKVEPFRDVVANHIMSNENFVAMKKVSEARIISEMRTIFVGSEFQEKKKEAIHRAAKKSFREVLLQYRNVDPVVLQEAVSEAMIEGVMIS